MNNLIKEYDFKVWYTKLKESVTPIIPSTNLKEGLLRAEGHEKILIKRDNNEYLIVNIKDLLLNFSTYPKYKFKYEELY